MLDSLVTEMDVSAVNHNKIPSLVQRSPLEGRIKNEGCYKLYVWGPVRTFNQPLRIKWKLVEQVNTCVYVVK